MKTAGSKTCAVLSKSVGLLGVREVEQRPLSGSPTGCAPTCPAPQPRGLAIRRTQCVFVLLVQKETKDPQK